MCRVRSVNLSIDYVDGKVVTYVDVDVDTYPYGGCLTDVVLVVDGEVYDSKSYNHGVRGVVRHEFVLSLPYGIHKAVSYARTRTDKMYPDEFIHSLRPVDKYGYVFYPVIYVRCDGETDKPRYITSQYGFRESIKDYFWYYDWTYIGVVEFVTEPLEYPKGYSGLKRVVWEGKFIFMHNIDVTTEHLDRVFTNFMTGYWGLEKSQCYTCIDGVTRKSYEEILGL